MTFTPATSKKPAVAPLPEVDSARFWPPLNRRQPQTVPATAQSTHSHPQKHGNEDPSIWRDTALRYLGYADEVGEFMGPYMGGLGKMLGYGISSLYVLADMGTTLPQKYHDASPALSRGQKIKKTGAEALDLGLFHYVATLLVPPMLIGKGAHWVDKFVTADNTWYGKKVQQSPALNAWAQKRLPWANRQLQPFLAKQGHGIAKFMAPVERWVQKKNPQILKRIPIFGQLLADLPGDLAAMRGLNDFQFDEQKIIRLMAQKPIPVAIGIGLVPLIAHPFDKLMLKIQDWTIRPLLGKNKLERDAQGRLKSVKNPTFWGHPPSAKPAVEAAAKASQLVAYFPLNQRNRPYLSYPTQTRFGIYPPTGPWGYSSRPPVF
jgi:hypothetical protein